MKMMWRCAKRMQDVGRSCVGNGVGEIVEVGCWRCDWARVWQDGEKLGAKAGCLDRGTMVKSVGGVEGSTEEGSWD
jgi:hypothetical protein